ncbi:MULTISPECIES: hypothetical protein [Arthrobacter]|uniref:DUF2339 domain-containing protein n=2 Tax=Arthrobacter TaxID=1663 RepID=A0ABU9KMX0_9MICC|nr:hypothetical protein [Arthrobacter sp. YJM1]MDP5228088.1 hypothetical protein [Arthrobacter sp. YJM1]
MDGFGVLLILAAAVVTGMVAYGRGKLAGEHDALVRQRTAAHAAGVREQDAYLKGHRDGWLKGMEQLGVAVGDGASASQPVSTVQPVRTVQSVSTAQPHDTAQPLSALRPTAPRPTATPPTTLAAAESPAVAPSVAEQRSMKPAEPAVPAGAPTMPASADPVPVQPRREPEPSHTVAENAGVPQGTAAAVQRPSASELRSRREKRVVNLTLYVASLLMVSAGAAFLAGDAAPVAKFAGVFALSVLFLVGGHLLFARQPRVKPAAIAFVGIGLASVPLCGVALDLLLLHQPRLSWFLASLAGLGAFVHATVRLKSKVLGYLVIPFLLSLVVSGLAVMGTGIVWTFVALLAFSALLSWFERRAPGWCPPVLLEPLRTLDPWLAPVIMAVELFFALGFSNGEHALVMAVLLGYSLLRPADEALVWRRVYHLLGRASGTAFLTFLLLTLGLPSHQTLYVVASCLALHVLLITWDSRRIERVLGWPALAEAGAIAAGLALLLLANAGTGWQLRYSYSQGGFGPVRAYQAETLWSWLVLGLSLAAAVRAAWFWRPRAEWFVLLPVTAGCLLPAIGFKGLALVLVGVSAFWLLRPEKDKSRARWFLAGAQLLLGLALPLGIHEFASDIPGRPVYVVLGGLAASVALALGHLLSGSPWRWGLPGVLAGAVSATASVLLLPLATAVGDRQFPGSGGWIAAATATAVLGAAVLAPALWRAARERSGGAVWAEAGYTSAVVLSADASLLWVASGAGARDSAWILAAAGATAQLLLAGLHRSGSRLPFVYGTRLLGMVAAAQGLDVLRTHAPQGTFLATLESPTVLVVLLALQSVFPVMRLAAVKGPDLPARAVGALAELMTLSVLAGLCGLFLYYSGTGALGWQWTLAAAVGLAMAGAAMILRPDAQEGALFAGCAAALDGIVVLSGGRGPAGYGLAIVAGAVLVLLLSSGLRSGAASNRHLYLLASRLDTLVLLFAVLRLLHADPGQSLLAVLGLCWVNQLIPERFDEGSGRIYARALRWTLLSVQAIAVVGYLATTYRGWQRWIAVIGIVSLCGASWVLCRRARDQWLMVPAVLGLLALAPVLGPGYVSDGPFLKDPVLDEAGMTVSASVLALLWLAPVVLRSRRTTARGGSPAVPGRALWFGSSAAFFVEALVFASETGRTWPAFAVLAAVAVLLLVLSHSEGLPVLYVPGVAAGVVAVYGLGLSVDLRADISYLGWLLPSALLALAGAAATWRGGVPRAVVLRRNMMLSANAFAVFVGTVNALASRPVVWSGTAFLLLGLLILLRQLAPAHRSQALQIGLLPVLSAAQRAYYWGGGITVETFWLLQWYLAYAAFLAVWHLGRKSAGHAFLFSCVFAGGASLSAILALTDGDAAQQFWVLVSFAAVVVAGLLQQRPLFSWWGSAGVLAGILFMFRSYVYLGLGLTAAALIAAVLVTLLRRKPPAGQA